MKGKYLCCQIVYNFKAGRRFMYHLSVFCGILILVELH